MQQNERLVQVLKRIKHLIRIEQLDSKICAKKQESGFAISHWMLGYSVLMVSVKENLGCQ